jgi:hypothetical protein
VKLPEPFVNDMRCMFDEQHAVRYSAHQMRECARNARYAGADLALDLLVSAGHIDRETAFQCRDVVMGEPPFEAAAIRKGING